MLVALATLDWDDELLALVGEASLLGATVPIKGIAGDQQAALYGQACRAPGETKAAYGTGSFLLEHTGDDASPPPPGLLKTAAADGYALEGAVLTSGAAVQWLRDGLGVLADAAESETLARGVERGITRGTTRAHLVRAALEAIAHKIADVVDALPSPPTVLRAEGGASANAFLMQLQADLLGVPVEVAAERETTALGAAALASGAPVRVRVGARYEPTLDPDEAKASRAAWAQALRR